MNTIRAIFVLVLALLVAACDLSALQIQVQTANALATAANTALPMLVERYRQEGIKAIEKATTKDEAEKAVAEVKVKWQPVWKAWETLRVAEDTWAKAIEARGEPGAALKSLSEAYCQLVVVWPGEIPALPLAPVRCSTVGTTP
jgi:hypothetical protein